MIGALALLALVSATYVSEPSPALRDATCASCCAAGGDCSKAFKGGPGICCGYTEYRVAQCCQSGVRCWWCNGEYRCGYRPIRCKTEYAVSSLDVVMTAALSACFVIAVARCACERRHPATTVVQGAPVVVSPGGVIVADRTGGAMEGKLLGFAGGMLLSDAMHDEPPSYVEAVTDGFAVDS